MANFITIWWLNGINYVKYLTKHPSPITDLIDMSWASSRSWWWTGKPGMLQSMGSQKVGHDWATELNWVQHNAKCLQKHVVMYIFRNYLFCCWWYSNHLKNILDNSIVLKQKSNLFLTSDFWSLSHFLISV